MEQIGLIFERFISVVSQLRAEEGCPWDKAQTALSLRPYLLEEAYEVLHAIDAGDSTSLMGELGDLMFCVVMLAQIATEDGEYSIGDVLSAITEKMVSRHPGVFADPSQADDGTIANWEARKASQRRDSVSALDGVPHALPALLRAHRISEKASGVGFDWNDVRGVRAKVDEEIKELDEAIESGERDRIEHELGDVLFTLVNLGRFLPVDAESALRVASNRFESRFRLVENRLALKNSSVFETSQEQLDLLWQEVKQEED